MYSILKLLEDKQDIVNYLNILRKVNWNFGKTEYISFDGHRDFNNLSDSYTILHEAIIDKRNYLVKLLVEYHDVNKKTEYRKFDTFDIAVLFKNFEALKFLDININTKEDLFKKVITEQNITAIKFFCENGFDLSKFTIDQFFPQITNYLEFACYERSSFDIIEYLAKYCTSNNILLNYFLCGKKVFDLEIAYKVIKLFFNIKQKRIKKTFNYLIEYVHDYIYGENCVAYGKILMLLLNSCRKLSKYMKNITVDIIRTIVKAIYEKDRDLACKLFQKFTYYCSLDMDKDKLGEEDGLYQFISSNSDFVKIYEKERLRRHKLYMLCLRNIEKNKRFILKKVFTYYTNRDIYKDIDIIYNIE